MQDLDDVPLVRVQTRLNQITYGSLIYQRYAQGAGDRSPHGLPGETSGAAREKDISGAGTFLTAGRIYFWLLLAERYLYLELEDGSSCLLRKTQ